MAGTFTHWMVAEKALAAYDLLPDKHTYFSEILRYNSFVRLGAVGPDYPYLTELIGAYFKIHSWADRMHYENTGEFVRNGIRSLAGLNGEAFNICLAFLCGFVTHLVTDSVIHPVVQAIVGPYIFNSGDHRHCELTQDSYIFHEIKGVEIGYGEYADLLRMCSDRNNSGKIDPSLRGFWTDVLEASHPTATPHFDKIDPDSWHAAFLSRISSASDPMPVFRHFAQEDNLAYKKTPDITPGERQRFVNEVKLPGNRTGAFKPDAFEKAVNKVVDTWKLLLVDIGNNNPEGPSGYIKNWNLDTGVDEDTQYFWR